MTELPPFGPIERDDGAATEEVTMSVYQSTDGLWRVRLQFDGGQYLVSEYGYGSKHLAQQAITEWCARHGAKMVTAQ